MLRDVEDYQSQITQIRFGKRVGTSVYFHADCVNELPDGIAGIAEKARQLAVHSDFEFNVYKFDTRAPLVSLLSYPGFFTDAFPTLTQSANWDTSSAYLNRRYYQSAASRPVLHRKELLLPIGHKMVDEFAALTEVAEQAGLFVDQSRIGRNGYWTGLLRDKGIKVIGHSLSQEDGQPITLFEPEKDILRYKTALRRNRLSVPVQMLFKHELLNEDTTFFDYGCGRGDDVQQLGELGVKASGWDPHFASNKEKKTADIVNLGYVVNVIESANERARTISDAYQYAKKILVVSALVGSAKYSGKTKPFNDGVITSTGTFQKYFQTHELAGLVKASVDVVPIAVAPGIMLAFKDEQAEQKFMAGRISRRKNGQPKARIRSVDELSADAQYEADQYWQTCIQYGRHVSRSEIDQCDELFKHFSSTKYLFQVLAQEKGSAEFDAACRSRKDELLVDFALSQFGKRLYFKYLPDSLKRDVKYHFGKFSALLDDAKSLLYSIADIDALLSACVDATEERVGYLLEDHSLQLHLSLLGKLAPILRVYVGCAGLLYGEMGQADLVKIHIQSGKVSFMGYDDFAGKPVPDLLERIKVRMWERKVDFFDYIGQFAPTPLFMKSLYIDESFDYFDEQSAFDQALMRTKLFDFMRENVSKAQFHGALQQAGLRIQGYDLAQVA